MEAEKKRKRIKRMYEKVKSTYFNSETTPDNKSKEQNFLTQQDIFKMKVA